MEHYKFFQNEKCEYFPCHKCENTADFNCLFCYCPLYALGDKCGGNFCYTEGGIKDCSYKTVLCAGDSVARDRRKNGDVHLDDICGSFLKLTNLEDVQVP